MWGNLSLKLINDTNELQIQYSLADLTKIQSGIGLNYSLQQYKKKHFTLSTECEETLVSIDQWYKWVADPKLFSRFNQNPIRDRT